MSLKKLFYTELAYRAFYASCPELCKTKKINLPGFDYSVSRAFTMKWGSFLTPALDREPEKAGVLSCVRVLWTQSCDLKKPDGTFILPWVSSL